MRAQRPLKVVFVITSMPVGGAETLLVNLIDRMDRRRSSAEVICLKNAGPLGGELAKRHAVHTNLLAHKYDLRILWRLTALLRRLQADAVITVGAGDKMFWGRICARLAGVPVVCSALHSTGWPDGVGRLNRLLTPWTDGFIAVADAHAEFMREFEKFPKEKIEVIRNGIDTDRFRQDPAAYRAFREELKLAPTTPLVGIVAALRPEKNHALFLRAAALIRRQVPEAHFVLIGDGPERSTIERLTTELELDGCVHLLGTRADTPRILAGLNVFGLSSLNEANPVSILEALSCQVPVVSTDVGSIHESVIQGVTGFRVPSGDEAQFCARVVELLKNPELAGRLGQEGRNLVLKTGSLTSMVDGYQTLIESLYSRKMPKKKARINSHQSVAVSGN